MEEQEGSTAGLCKDGIGGQLIDSCHTAGGSSLGMNIRSHRGQVVDPGSLRQVAMFPLLVRVEQWTVAGSSGRVGSWGQ